jgi:hypothetical protein
MPTQSDGTESLSILAGLMAQEDEKEGQNRVLS